MSRRWDQPGITIRLEAPSRDRDSALLRGIDALTAESGPTSVLVLLAHPLARARVLKGLLEGHPDGRLLPPLRSIGAFALEAADVDDAATPVDGGLRRSLLTELIAERRGTGPLRALSGARDLPGLVRAIDHFFQALGRQRIWTAAALDTLVHVYRRGRLLRVDRDIVTLYERYRALVPRRRRTRRTPS